MDSNMTLARAERNLNLYARGKIDSAEAEQICRWLPAHHPQDASRVAAHWEQVLADYQCRRQHAPEDTVAVRNVTTWAVTMVGWLVDAGASRPAPASCQHGDTFR